MQTVRQTARQNDMLNVGLIRKILTAPYKVFHHWAKLCNIILMAIRVFSSVAIYQPWQGGPKSIPRQRGQSSNSRSGANRIIIEEARQLSAPPC